MKSDNALLLVALSIIFFFSAVSGPAASPTKRFDPNTNTMRNLTFPNLEDGRKLFTTVCKNCHHRGNDQNAKFIHTESKSMRAWTRLFFQKYSKCAQNGAWDALSNNDLLKLNDYLYRYASDSYNPNDAADCG